MRIAVFALRAPTEQVVNDSAVHPKLAGEPAHSDSVGYQPLPGLNWGSDGDLLLCLAFAGHGGGLPAFWKLLALTPILSTSRKNRVTVGKRLKEERKRLRLTQQEMAEACGVSKWAQLYFEKDQNMPGGAYLLAAHARGVDLMYVLLEQRAELDPSEAALLAAFRAAPQELRTAMLSNLVSPRSAGEKAAPVVTFNDSSQVAQMLTNTGDIDQSNMQINMGGRKKKKS